MASWIWPVGHSFPTPENAVFWDFGVYDEFIKNVVFSGLNPKDTDLLG